VILIIGLVGTVKAFTSPTVTTTKQAATLLSYQQNGIFDYKASIKPSNFYGTNQQAIPSSPNIPMQFIDSLTMGYQYSSPDDQVQVEIDAVVEEPNNWQKMVTIVPKETEKGNFTISFPIDLKSFQTLAATIDKELGATGFGTPSLNVNVIATVYGKDATFTQTLAISVGQIYLVIGNNLLQTQSGSTGIYSYSVALSDNTLFGATTISSPQISTPTPIVLGSTDTIFTRLLDNLNFTYQYNVTADQPLQPTETVVVNATLANPGKWSKTFALVPTTQENGNFALNFPLDLTQYLAVISDVQQETGVSATAYTLTVEADVDLKAQTSAGAIDKIFSDSISTDLTGGVLTWTGDLNQSDKGTITTTSNVQTPAKTWGIQVTPFRVISIVILVIGMVLLAMLFLIPSKLKDQQAISKQKATETERKYKNMIITVNKLPEHLVAESILAVDSLDELIKVAQALLKPINHFVDTNVDIYWITDGTTCYEYQVDGGSPSVDESLGSS
jgi:hypothetical protein